MADTTETATTNPAPAAPAAPPAATPAPVRLADAVLVPSSYKTRSTGPRQWHRVKAVLDIAEPLLGVDRSKGQLGYARAVGMRADDGKDNGSGSRYLLCTKNPVDTLLYGKAHEKAGQNRYQWMPTASDPLVKVGYLIDPS